MKYYLYVCFIIGLLAFLVGCSSDQPTETRSTLEQGIVGVNNTQDNTSVLAKTSGTAAINASSTAQYIRGFGGMNFPRWIGDLTSAQTTKAFGTGSGQIGLSVLRTDVPPSSSNWAANVATAKIAKSYGAIVFATPWSPPASMKDNNSLIKGSLKTSSYGAYAAHLKSYCDYMSSNGASLYAVSLQNEPDWLPDYESCGWNATQFVNFLTGYGSAVGYPILVAEAVNMSRAITDPILNNATAASKVKAIAGHLYGGGISDYTLARSKGKEVWATEHITDTQDGNLWSGAMVLGKELHDCMVVNFSVYTWWYIRRSYGLITEDGNVSKRGYVMSHFSRFVRPGYYRISCTANPTSGVYVTAYKNGSKIVVVALNQNSATTFQAFTYSGVTLSGFTRYKTTSSSNLAQDSFTVSGGSFGINLPASSITTLVSN